LRWRSEAGLQRPPKPTSKTILRGTARVGFHFTLNMAAYNLARLPKLLAAAKRKHHPAHNLESPPIKG